MTYKCPEKPCPWCGTMNEPSPWAYDPLDGLRGRIHQLNCTVCGADSPPASSPQHAARMWDDRSDDLGNRPQWWHRHQKKRKSTWMEDKGVNDV